MKKHLFTLVLALFMVSFSIAQQSISGKVSDSSGEPLVGASILVKGTTSGAVTDFEGNYSLEAPASATTLVFSYTGYESREIEINNQSVIDLTMTEGVMLFEAVVTALGITRDKKSLTYAAQEVKNEDLNISRSAGFVDALTGKVAGVQIVGAPSSGFREGNIRIRGVGGLSTSNPPLYVLDGTPVDASAVNMDNVESVSVLKGPAASALYGQRASNGVVVVTSKKGKKGPGIGLEFNSSSTFDNVSLLPEYQNEYAGGYDQDFQKFTYNPAIHPSDWAKFNGQNMLNYQADESWGPKMDGRLYRPYYSWYEGPDFGVEIPLNPQPDNVKNFFQTGKVYNNNIAFSGGGDNYSFRVNYNNITKELVIPNTRQAKNIVSMIGTFDLSKFISVGANINYKKTDQYGNIREGYGAGLSGSFNQWFHRQLDVDRLRQYKNPDGTFNSWNIGSPENTQPLYWDNPYYDVYENVPHSYEDRVYGDFSITLNLAKNLKLQGFVRSDVLNANGDNRFTEGGLGTPSYSYYKNSQTELNYEALASYNNRSGKFSYDFNLGANIRKDNDGFSSASTVGGLAIPGYYNIASSVDRPNVSESSFQKEVRSVYGRGSLGFNDFAYLDFSIRNDWSSALPTGENSYLYPMIGGTLVFSELLPTNNILSFGKIRYSYAQVGSDIGPHQINPIYSSGAFYGSNATLSVPNTLRNENLKPQLTSTHEAGIEMKFLKNRVGLDVTYYTDVNENQILSLTIPATSGYSVAIINAGRITREGVEVQLNLVPVQTRDFNWDLTFNWATNTSQVDELADGLDNRQLGTSPFGPTLNAKVGEQWGVLIGRAFRRDDNGNRLVGSNGRYLFDNNVDLGSILPDFTGGMINTINYKGIQLRAALDYQQGGKFYSTSAMFNAYSGLGAETVGLNDKGTPKRDPVSAGGGVRAEGVTADGQANSVYLEADAYYKSLFRLSENWIFDATYLKIREVSIGYNFNPKKLGLGFATKLNVALVGRNLAYFGKDTKKIGFDPSEAESNGWFEGGQLPQTRAFGFNISLGF
ncbi:MAG: SusC/RagA family TonB-linked outer membrane protein [Saprospiraceae bacterium]